MNFEVLNKFPLFRAVLDKRLAYYSSSLFLLADGQLTPIENNKKRIVIVAKSHYTEHWQIFSAISKAELNKLLALKKQSANLNKTIFQVVENQAVDGFEVKTIEFAESLVNELGKANVYIPETELFHADLNEVLEIETPAGILFSSYAGKKVHNAYAKGIVANIETYRLSAGLPSDNVVRRISSEVFPKFLLTCLYNLPLSQLTNKALVNPREWIDLNKLHWLYGAPLLTALSFYLLSNSYLAFSVYNLELSIDDNKGKVSNVLTQKQGIDKKEALLNQLSSELASRNLIHNYWEIIYQIVEEGATVTRITFKKGELTIRGKTDKASVLLAKVAENQGVEAASFKGPVRKSGNQESFVINIVPKESV